MLIFSQPLGLQDRIHFDPGNPDFQRVSYDWQGQKNSAVFFEITFDMSRGRCEYRVLQIPYVTLCYTTFLSTLNPPCEFREPGLPEAVEDFLMHKEKSWRYFHLFYGCKEKVQRWDTNKKGRFFYDQMISRHLWRQPPLLSDLMAGSLGYHQQQTLAWYLRRIFLEFSVLGKAWCQINQLDQKHGWVKQFGSIWIIVYWNHPLIGGFHDFAYR